MKLRILKTFEDKLNDQVDYIAKDKPSAAKKFKSDIIKRIKEIPFMPFANRKSIFFDREDIRDLIFKGYIVVYIVDDKKELLQYSVLRNTKMIHLKRFESHSVFCRYFANIPK